VLAWASILLDGPLLAESAVTRVVRASSSRGAWGLRPGGDGAGAEGTDPIMDAAGSVPSTRRQHRQRPACRWAAPPSTHCGGQERAPRATTTSITVRAHRGGEVTAVLA
jgi:hypothetical protein